MARDPLTSLDGAARFMSGVIGTDCNGANALVIPKALSASVTFGESVCRALEVVAGAINHFECDVGPKKEVSPTAGSVGDFLGFAVKRISRIFEVRVDPARQLLTDDQPVRRLLDTASLIVQDFVGLIRREARDVSDRLSKKMGVQIVDLEMSLRELEGCDPKVAGPIARHAQDQMQSHAKIAGVKLKKLITRFRRILDERRSYLAKAEMICRDPGNLESPPVLDAFKNLGTDERM